MKIGCFLKFGKYEHLESLAQGDLFFSTASIFREREMELQKGIGDRYEGGFELAQTKGIVSDIGGKRQDLIYKTDLYFEELNDFPVFCLTACLEEECYQDENGIFLPAIDIERLNWFTNQYDSYDSVAVIENPNLFIEDVENKFDGYVKHKKIVYQDKETKNGSHPLGMITHIACNGDEIVPNTVYFANKAKIIEFLFFKDTFFELENEYRFVVTNKAIKKATTFHVNMRSPVKIYSLETLRNR